MGLFKPSRVHFGRAPSDNLDNGDGIPNPIKIKASVRRADGIREAKNVLEHLPGPGESLHAIVTARLDLTDVINALLERVGACDRLTIATLGYNQKNLRQMLGWLNAGQVKSLTLLASLFFRSHNGGLWEETLKEFRERGQRAACCHSHAKVVAARFADGSAYSIEGSANLCGNGSGREQFALFNCADLAVWHSAWIESLVSRHESPN